MKFVYKLTHKRVVEIEKETGEKIYNTKLLGFFSSRQRCNEAISFYQNILGFKDYPEDFLVEEIEADVDDYNDVPGEFDEFVYYLSHEWYDGEFDYVSSLGYYSILDKAEEAKAKYACEEVFIGYPSGFCIAKCEIGKMNWTEGFVNWSDEDE